MPNWTREQTIIALGVYCKIPFNKASNSNPEIISAARLIGRSPSAVKMKVGNFGSFDPHLKAKGIVGLTNSSKLDEEIWEEYSKDWEKLAYDCEKIKAKLLNKTIEESAKIDIDDLPIGDEREIIVRQRINQNFFRTTVLCAYLYQCCITGISNPQLLEACHISSWSEDINNRTNPHNGLCLNPLFHRAFDKYLIAVDPDYRIVVSEHLLSETKDKNFNNYLLQLQGRSIIMPEKFKPDKNLLAKHYEQYRTKQ